MWTGTVRKDGYGVLNVQRDGRTVQVRAHRYCYELLIGPIPGGAVLDHTCHSRSGCRAVDRECLHRRCIRPDHLEPVTHTENARRAAEPRAVLQYATHCANGHPFNEANTRVTPNGWRRCRTCHRAQVAAAAERKLGPVPAGRKRRPSDKVGKHNLLKTHCPQGHPYSPENTRTPPSGGRYCRACERERGRRRGAR